MTPADDTTTGSSSTELGSEIFNALKARAATFRSTASRQRPGSMVALAALLVVVFPLWLCIVLPLGILAIIHRCTCHRLTAKKFRRDILSAPEVARVTEEELRTPFPARTTRDIDVVILGATGLTGGLLAEYLLGRHPDLKLALAGRSKTKLDAVRTKLDVMFPGRGRALPIIVADAFDLPSLFAMCRRCNVVATTVGPYARFGSLTYHACAHSGTGYCDITGEGRWVSHMRKLYDGAARKSGASLLSFCGVDSVPSMVGAHEVCKRLAEAGATYASAERIEALMVRFSGSLPAGTLETVAGAIDSIDGLQRPPAGFKPPEATAHAGRTRIRGLFSLPSRSRFFKQISIPFVMAAPNSFAVRRSNSLCGFAKDVTYCERWGFPDWPGALVMFLGLYVMATPAVALPLLRVLARTLGFLPSPSAGVSAYSRAICKRGAISMLVGAEGRRATVSTANTASVVGGGGDASATQPTVRASVRVSGLGDAGGAFTSICQGETAALLARSPGAVQGAGLTPMGALGGDAVSKQLVASGLIFIDDVPAELLCSQ